MDGLSFVSQAEILNTDCIDHSRLYRAASPLIPNQCAHLSAATRTSSQVTFPVDFFEHNQQLTEVEFGGNDLLQVYNGQQIKHRLNSTGMYVANTKVGIQLGKWGK